MAEAYIDQVIQVVEQVCKVKNVSEGLFWYWLGNTKFKQDDGNLTPQRADEIKRDISALINEYFHRVKEV